MILPTSYNDYHVPPTVDAPELSATEKQQQFAHIKQLLQQQDAVIVAHYYTDPAIQELAEATGGLVADSLQMAQFGREHPARTLIVAGVRFMGETAKILSPEKRVFMPTLAATCSLDLSCPADLFAAFCAQHPERTVVVYANTSAAVKACADWVVTSSIGLPIIEHLVDNNEKIIWGPDRYLGEYLQQKTGADMLLWQGSCVVHEEFKANALQALKQQYPEAAVLVHPESPAAVIAQADVVGSTIQLVKAAQTLPNPVFIVATDRGIFYKMQQVAPHKQLIAAPTAGNGATCRSCAHCPWMAMNNLANLADCIGNSANAIEVAAELIPQAMVPLQRMLDFAKR